MFRRTRLMGSNDPNFMPLGMNGLCCIKNEGDAEVPFPARKISGDNDNFHKSLTNVFIVLSE
jgi:hypothetical protein